MTPLVSIILPTHNREAYLRDAIGSVLSQTYARWELIVVDDGSTDGTAAYLRDLAEPRLRVVTHERCANPARLRNAGLARATGPYVAFIDSDDRWAPEKLTVQVAALTTPPGHRWSYTSFGRIDRLGAPFSVAGARPWTPRSGWILPHILRDEVQVALPSVLAERTLMAEAGGFDESLVLCSDYDMWVRLASRAQAVAVSAPLVQVRAHPTNWTKGRGIQAYELLERVYQKLLADLSDGELRVLARRRYGRALIGLATQRRLGGDYLGALQALRRAVRYRPVPGTWLLALAKIMVRPAIPDRIMSRYYARRWETERDPGRMS